MCYGYVSCIVFIEGHAGQDGEEEEYRVIQEAGQPVGPAPSIELDALDEDVEYCGQEEDRDQEERSDHGGLVKCHQLRILSHFEILILHS